VASSAWGQTTKEEHAACIGKNATNDPAESPFAQLTRQLHCFGRILGIHASGVGHARINSDFNCDIKDTVKDGAYFKTPNERESFVAYALCSAPAVCREEKV
jgi:hypothetical protein